MFSVSWNEPERERASSSISLRLLAKTCDTRKINQELLSLRMCCAKNFGNRVVVCVNILFFCVLRFFSVYFSACYWVNAGRFDELLNEKRTGSAPRRGLAKIGSFLENFRGCSRTPLKQANLTFRETSRRLRLTLRTSWVVYRFSSIHR